MTKELLIIFTRNPEPGKCKTRLAAVIGDTAALNIYRFLLEHTRKITRDLDVAKEVHYSNNVPETDDWDYDFTKVAQCGADLGQRMLHAFEQGFEKGFEKIIIIGSDIYDLRQKDLEVAFNELNKHDYVLGPAQDGGYYLLGMKKIKEAIFMDKAWGSNTVLQETLKDLENENLALLAVRNDIDVYEDIRDIPVFRKFIKA